MFKGVRVKLSNDLTSIYSQKKKKTEVQRHLVEFLKDSLIRVAIKGSLEHCFSTLAAH